MNQHQRKFLLDAIEKQYKSELDKLRKRRPEPVSLNNYLIAAILDGSFLIKQQDTIRDALRKRVRSLGKGKALVSPTQDKWGIPDDKDSEDKISIPVEVLFEYPPEYALAKEQYENALKEWEVELANLESSIAAMRIKVQVGSDKALEALVAQADAICSMSLTASNKLLSGQSNKLLN